MAKPAGVNITIATFPTGEVRLDNELALIKPALLYADHVTLTSTTASVLKELTHLESLSRYDRVHATLQLLSVIEVDNRRLDAEQLAHLYQIVHTDRNTRRQWSREDQATWKRLRAEWDRMESELLREWSQRLIPNLRRQYEASSAPDLEPALRAGLLTLNAPVGEDGDWSIQALTAAFFSAVQAILDDLRSFPLFDDRLNNYVRMAIDEGQFTVASLANKNAAEVATAAAFMGGLPSFPQASVREVLDIRRELRSPLIRFRSAVAEISAEMDATPFDQDFAAHVDNVNRTKIQPAFLEIKEAVESNKYLKQLVAASFGDATSLSNALLAGGMAFLIASQEAVSNLAAVPTAAGVTAATAVYAQRKQAEQISRHKIFFLYRTEELLGQRTSS